VLKRSFSEIPEVITQRKRQAIWLYSGCTLVLGEEDFSLSRSLAELGILPVTPTSLHSKNVVLDKYPEAEKHISKLEELSCSPLFEIDALSPSLKELLHKNSHVLFTFPRGVRGPERQRRKAYISENSRFLTKLLDNLSVCGQEKDSFRVKIALYGHQAVKWKLERVAFLSGFKLLSQRPFVEEDLPWYTPRDDTGKVFELQSRAFLYDFKLQESKASSEGRETSFLSQTPTSELLRQFRGAVKKER